MVLLLLLLLLLLPSLFVQLLPSSRPAQPLAVGVSIDWADELLVTNTAATVEVDVMPWLARTDWGGPFNAYYEALGDLGAEYVRFSPWMPNPRMTVPELTPSDCDSTHPATNWNSTIMDATVRDFMFAVCGENADQGECKLSVVPQLSTMPSYMYVGGYCPNATFDCLAENPYDPYPFMGGGSNLYITGYSLPCVLDSSGAGHCNGTKIGSMQMTDPSCGQMARYMGRLVGWYTAGHFVDECGHRHDSGLFYNWWGVSILNEGEHKVGGATTKGQAAAYNQCFDKMEVEIRKYNQNITLVGDESLGGESPDLIQFMMAENHATNKSPPVASFHGCGDVVKSGTNGQEGGFRSIESCFRSPTRPIQRAEALKKKTGQDTKMILNEFILMVDDWCDTSTIPDSINQSDKKQVQDGCPAQWGNSNRTAGNGTDGNLQHMRGVRANRRTLTWNAAASIFAMGYGMLAELQYLYVGVDQFIGGPWPDNNPEVTCLDWNTGEPNAKYWVTQLLAQTVGGKQNKTIVASNVTFNSTTWARIGDPLLNGSNWVNESRPLYVLPYIDHETEQKGILLVNKLATPMDVTIAGLAGGSALSVEVATEGAAADAPGYQPTVHKRISADGVLSVGPFATAVVTDVVGALGRIEMKTDDATIACC